MIKYLHSNNFKKIVNKNIESIYHFSNANYYDPNNINFGKLRVFNDEVFKPGAGFDLHLHRNLEIITYVIEGSLTHKDSLNNYLTLKAGDIQHMSAGKGIYHSEFNEGDQDLKLIQIWILPEKRNLDPTHSLFETKNLELNQLHKVACKEDAPLLVNQDVNIYILRLEKDKEINFEVLESRQAYLVSIEGSSIINQIEVKDKDALEVIEENLSIKALTDSHFIIIEMKKG
ncbi:MAG TPA: pirin family protein [Acholeplasmataceae bacterium]|nr:pirin family protein [Acholeplasmataceae bacterium]